MPPITYGTIISVNECEVQFTNTKFVVFEWEQGKLKLKAMASDKSFVDFVVDQIENAGQITYKKMFGEYALYCDGKVIALVCDNRLLVKPTEAGRSFIGNVVEASAYTGAKLSFLIDDRIEDREWISNLIRITFNELPEQKIKKKKNK